MKLKKIKLAVLAAIAYGFVFVTASELTKADDSTQAIQSENTGLTETDSSIVSGGAVETISPGAVNVTGGAVVTGDAINPENPYSDLDIEEYDEFTVGGVYYTVTGIKDGKVYVGVNGVDNDRTTTVYIPKTIKYKDIEMIVDSIEEEGFSYLERLRKVIVNADITRIGKNAFKGAEKFSRLIFKTDVLKKVGKNIFKGVSNKLTIEVLKKKVGAYAKLFKNKGIKIKEIKAIKAR